MKIQGAMVLDKRFSSEKLILACLDGNGEAWAHFFRRYKDVICRSIYSTVKRWSLSPKERKECCREFYQDIAVALMDNDGRRLKQYQSINGSVFSSWLRVVVSRLVIDLLRKKKIQVHSVETYCEDHSTNKHYESCQDRALRDKEQVLFVRQVIKELAPLDNLIMHLIYETGTTPKATASIVGMSTGAVYTRVHRILASIKEQAANNGLL